MSKYLAGGAIILGVLSVVAAAPPTTRPATAPTTHPTTFPARFEDSPEYRRLADELAAAEARVPALRTKVEREARAGKDYLESIAEADKAARDAEATEDPYRKLQARTVQRTAQERADKIVADAVTWSKDLTLATQVPFEIRRQMEAARAEFVEARRQWETEEQALAEWRRAEEARRQFESSPVTIYLRTHKVEPDIADAIRAHRPVTGMSLAELRLFANVPEAPLAQTKDGRLYGVEVRHDGVFGTRSVSYTVIVGADEKIARVIEHSDGKPLDLPGW